MYYKSGNPPRDMYSEALGQSGRRYVYVFSTNSNYVYDPNNISVPTPPSTSIPDPIDLRGELPVRTGYNKDQPYPPRDVNAVTAVDIHYTASAPSTSILAIAQYQIGPQAQEAFPAIAYHFMIDEVGDYHLLHDLDRRVWHNGAPNRNNIAIGICYIGNTQPNDAQIKGMQNAITYSEQQLGRDLTISGHRDTYATQCPGNSWPVWKSKLK